MPRKRPCSICRRWFRPDARTVRHQRACSKPECQVERRKRTQASWRGRNPEYGVGYRIDGRSAEGEHAEPRRLPAPLSKLPWQLAKDVFGSEGADFIGVTSALLLRTTKDVIAAHLIDFKGDRRGLPVVPAKDLIAADAE